MVVVGYGQIIPQSVIDIPPLGILNVHASLLPKYRGAGPIQWAIINGETRTGVTIMRIDAGLDTGDMLLKAETEIGADENAVELGRRLAAMGAGLLVEALDSLAAGKIVPEKQDAPQATYAPLFKKEDGRIDWSQSAAVIHNRVRGLQPWPGAYTSWRGQTLHIWRARPAAAAGGPPPGTIASAKPLVVACGLGALELLEVQLEGRKRLPAAEFANGQRLRENELLGSLREST
jgi:methionyl-tRNA formyltransferase